MKYFLCFIIFMVSATVGAAGGAYYMRHSLDSEFYQVTNMTWDEFLEPKKSCEARPEFNFERCVMIGGFVPRSQVTYPDNRL